MHYAIGLLVIVVTLIYIYFKRAFQYWKNRGVTYLEPKIPMGNTNLNFFSNHGVEITRLYQQYKKMGLDYVGYYLLARPVLIPIDPELIKLILSKDFNHFDNRGIYCNAEKDPLTDNLFCTNGDRWKILRTKLTPIFSPGKLKTMYQVMVTCGKSLVKTVEPLSKTEKPIDIKELCGAFTTDIIASTLFGIECDSMTNKETAFRKYGREFFAPTFIENLRMVTGVIFPKLLEFFKIKWYSPTFTKYFCNAMTEVVDYREKTKFERKDFMNLLIRLKNKMNLDDDSRSEDGITMDELLAQCFIFYVAGFETSATTLTYCIFEVAQNMDIQQKLRDEIESVVAKYNGELTYDAIMEMEYLDKIVCETLRKYPPLVVLNRECSENFKIPNSKIVIEKGTSVIIPTIGIQRDPEIYPDPFKFDPERFSPEEKAKRHPFTYLPFGEGPRNCIGLRFGLLEVKIGITHLVKNFLLKTHPKSDVPLKPKCDIIILAHYGHIYVQATKLKT